MASQAPYEGREDLAAIEAELARARRPQSGGWLAFDVLFGLVTPAVLLVADPAVFTHSVAARSAFPAYLAGPFQVVAGVLGVGLAVWLVTGARVPALGLVLGGPFAVGTLLAGVMAGKLVGFGVIHAELLSGLLALTLWLTVVVFARHTVRALRAGAGVSVVLAVLSLAVGGVVVGGGFSLVASRRVERAEFIEGLFFSEDAGDHRRAMDLMLETGLVDTDRLVEGYVALPEEDPRRERVAESYLRLTGEPMEAAVRRLRYGIERAPGRPEPRPGTASPAEKTAPGAAPPLPEPPSPRPEPRTRSGAGTAPRTPAPTGSPAAPAR